MCNCCVQQGEPARSDFPTTCCGDSCLHCGNSLPEDQYCEECAAKQFVAEFSDSLSRKDITRVAWKGGMPALTSMERDTSLRDKEREDWIYDTASKMRELELARREVQMCHQILSAILAGESFGSISIPYDNLEKINSLGVSCGNNWDERCIVLTLTKKEGK